MNVLHNILSILHLPMPIGTILPIGVVCNGTITPEIDGRHSMVVRTGVAGFGTPSALVLSQRPSDRRFVLVGPSLTRFQIVACDPVPFGGAEIVAFGESVVEGLRRNAAGEGSENGDGTSGNLHHFAIIVVVAFSFSWNNFLYQWIFVVNIYRCELWSIQLPVFCCNCIKRYVCSIRQLVYALGTCLAAIDRVSVVYFFPERIYFFHGCNTFEYGSLLVSSTFFVSSARTGTIRSGGKRFSFGQ